MVAAAGLRAQFPVAQQPQEQATPTFQAGAALVRVDVQVLDGKRPVAGLTANDFVVREEGVERRPVSFGVESEPLQVVLLLDVSGSMGKMLRAMAAVGRQALAQLKPQDQVAVFLFARETRLAAELSSDLAVAELALKDAPMEKGLGAGTSVNDAILDVTNYFRRQPPFAGRRAVIVLTDNGGVHFKVPDEMVIHGLSDVHTVLNGIVPSEAKPPRELKGPGVNPDFTPANVFYLAAASGGEVLRSDDAGARFKELLERIRLRYSLLLKPTPAPPDTFRRLEVELSAEARRRYPKAEVHARSGYYAP